MIDFIEPIPAMRSRRTNQTLHGRSVFRPVDVPGHNVFKGYTDWANNGHVGVGDAVDLFGQAGEAVYAISDCVQTVWRNDATRLEVIYLEGEGWLAVYAHINARHEGINIRIPKGDVVGHLRGDLADPHVHFELWLDGVAVSARSGGILRDTMMLQLGLSAEYPQPNQPRLVVAKPAGNHPSIDGFIYSEVPSRWDEANDVIDVDTHALAVWLHASANGLPAFQPIRATLIAMGFTNSTFNLTHLSDPVDPRVYAFAA